MRRHVWGKPCHFSFRGKISPLTLYCSTTNSPPPPMSPPHAKQASRIVAVAICRNEDNNRQTVSVLVSALPQHAEESRKRNLGLWFLTVSSKQTAEDEWSPLWMRHVLTWMVIDRNCFSVMSKQGFQTVVCRNGLMLQLETLDSPVGRKRSAH